MSRRWRSRPAAVLAGFPLVDAGVSPQTLLAEPTLAYYNDPNSNDPNSVDAQWHVFVATPEGGVVGHYNAEDFAEHLREMLDDGSFRATEEGVWVNHEDVNPATGDLEDKHFRLVEHDGPVFGFGWHHDESGASRAYTSLGLNLLPH